MTPETTFCRPGHEIGCNEVTTDSFNIIYSFPDEMSLLFTDLQYSFKFTSQIGRCASGRLYHKLLTELRDLENVLHLNFPTM